MDKIFRIEIDFNGKDSESVILENKFKSLGLNITLKTSQVYTINYDFSDLQINKIADALHTPIVQKARINFPINEKFDWALEIGFLPGVTDNVANTTAEIINDLLKIDIGRNKVFSSRSLFISGPITKTGGEMIANELTNPLINRFHIKSYNQYIQDKGMDLIVPTVHLEKDIKVLEINLNISEEELTTIGKQGILDPETNQRRGPLALDLDYMKAIKNYFSNLGRNPTDIEVESIAQTWSEHCKHTYFAAKLDDIKEGLFNRYIKKATEEVRKELGDDDFCVSVFKDNSGGIIFDERYLITDKVETHNSPSALDPFGGAITGIVGVNRDTIGFGLGAKPIANRYGFCFGRLEDKKMIYRSRNKTGAVLLPKRIMEGVIHGVNVGGNCSGIPTPQGFVYFDDSYKGKPLVFVGTVGLIPRKLSEGTLSHEKKAKDGDNIVVIGGRVGKDGIHGATFSSEALDSGSPATAVQIGDPITQKKLSDAVVKEAREKKLYNSITDNGAGGLSCSVAEMAKECGGFTVDLENVPLKYPGLQPWEIWISESQERMTLAVSDDKLIEFKNLMNRRGVECSVIGKFNDSGKAIVRFNEKEIFNLEMDFLHNGLPKRELTSKPYPYNTIEPEINVLSHSSLFKRVLGSHNICSYEFISRQYDHEVQNNSIIKPLQGAGRANNHATVIRPILSSKKGVVLSQSLYPRLSQISCYDMAACAIDTAIRNCVAVGGNINHLALLDNFCWCSSNEPERIAQLKETAKACYDYSVAYKTPFISGKDSMFNDFKGFDEGNFSLKISVLPTLLISSIGVIEEVEKTTTMDFKIAGDLIYVIGETKDECGGSEFYHMFNEIGTKSPKVDAIKSRILYEKIYELHQKEIFNSCSSVVNGLLITLAKMAISGMKGINVNLQRVPQQGLSLGKIMYSESQSRLIAVISRENKDVFEKEMKDFIFGLIGEVRGDSLFIIKNGDIDVIRENIEDLEMTYKERFKNM